MIQKIYAYITSKKRIEKYRRLDSFLHKIGGNFYVKTLGQLKYKLHFENSVTYQSAADSDPTNVQLEPWNYERKSTYFTNPLVSVIVPNYNHASFLVERLESIYNQSYKNIEVILLDDCSTDSSRDILSRYAQAHAENTITIFNTENSHHVFKQWNKGMQASHGQLIWIAESDDYCELDFLEKMVALFCYDSVMLAFARSVFVQDGQKIWSTEEYLHDLPLLKWDAPFYMSANDLVKKGFAIHNIIPNVSSAVFRNTGMISEEVQTICGNMHLSGDWIFYLNLMRGGVVAYTNETTNYYRIHPQSTSLKIQKTSEYYTEFEAVSCYIARNYSIDNSVFDIILNNLKEHYRSQNNDSENFNVENYYSVSKILKEKEKRTPNIIMACYAICSGGGETFPIFLANEIRKQGYSVTLLNFDLENEKTEIRKLIAPNVPTVNMLSTDYIGQILYHLNADIVHSHNACVDYALALWISANPALGKHIITLHGMYESIEKEDCKRVINATWKTCYKYAHVADKNIICFKEQNHYAENRFVKMPNGLPRVSLKPIDRSSLNIESDDFVYVLASRGLPEKGWDEAIKATIAANKTSSRKIHLVILGDGEEKKRLENDAPDFIHFIGTVSNVRDYFAMADAGLLPSRFKGESHPLVIIECLMTGKPVVSTAIAEVPNQIVDDSGRRAGLLVPLHNWQIDITELTEAMLRLATDQKLYQELLQNTFYVCDKFSIEKISGLYLDLYKEALQ